LPQSLVARPVGAGLQGADDECIAICSFNGRIGHSRGRRSADRGGSIPQQIAPRGRLG